jgi:energy-coupling factor transport system ATP-binding protein
LKDFQPGRSAVLFQTPEEGFFASTVEEEVALGYRSFRGEDGVKTAVREALDSVGLDFAEFAGRNPFTLSQGEKRLVAIASLLVIPAEIYLLDEPALFLDGSAGRAILRAVRRLAEREISLLIASHHRGFLAGTTVRSIHLRKPPLQIAENYC